MSGQEYVILLDEQHSPVGTQEKYAAHHTHTPLHLAFSCWLFNHAGHCLITRRAMAKKAWPGVWTNSVCGHPQPGETFEQAIVRRCRIEIDATVEDITAVNPAFHYCETDPSGIVENEVCPVYAARLVGKVQLNHDEVMACQWSELTALFCALDAAPWAFSPWMVAEVASPAMREKLLRFASTGKS